MEAMYREVGCITQKMNFWFLSNQLEVCHETLFPLENGRDLNILIDMIECNYKLVMLYATSNSPTFDEA